MGSNEGDTAWFDSTPGIRGVLLLWFGTVLGLYVPGVAEPELPTNLRLTCEGGSGDRVTTMG